MIRKIQFLPVILLLSLFGLSQSAFSQVSPADTSKNDKDLTPVPKSSTSVLSDDGGVLYSETKPKGAKWNLGGYYRFYSYHNELNQNYSLTPVKTTMTQMSDLTLSEPTMLLFLSCSPNSKVNFYTDIMFINPYNGGAKENIFKRKQAMNFFASMQTKALGTINVRFGGLLWYELSTLTLGVITMDGRYSIFDRTPWEGSGKVNTKYDNFYATGLATTERWGKRPFQGLILEDFELPLKLGVKAMLGRTDQNGTYAIVTPNIGYGGSIIKTISPTKRIAFNSFNSIAYEDSSYDKKAYGYNIHTLELSYEVKKIIIQGEFGMGTYYSASFDSTKHGKQWSPGGYLKLNIPSDISKINLKVQGYYFGNNFVNPNGGVANTSIQELSRSKQITGTSTVVAVPFAGPMTMADQYANNRYGFVLSTDFKIGKNLKVNIANGISKELERVSNGISFGHPVLALTMNRILPPNQYWDWWKNTPSGPYNRMHAQFRGVYEVATISDTAANGLPNADKNFNVLELQLKYKNKIFNKQIIFLYSGAASSVQSSFSPIPVFTDKAWIQTQSHQLDIYYQILPKLMLCGYGGIERNIGNTQTDVVEKIQPSYVTLTATEYDKVIANKVGLARDQFGYAVGLGVDVELAKNTGLYVRGKYVNYQDRNFRLDVFQGYELITELKITF